MENLRISTKRVPKVSQSEPKGAKGSQKGAKRCQKWAKREPTGAKREPLGGQRVPKVSQGATKMHKKTDLQTGSRKIPKKGAPPEVTTVHFWCNFPPKIDEKSLRKSVPKKWRKSKKKRCENGPTFWWFSDLLPMKNRVFRKRCMCENHSIYRVERVSARVHRKRRKAKTDKKL